MLVLHQSMLALISACTPGTKGVSTMQIWKLHGAVSVYRPTDNKVQDMPPGLRDFYTYWEPCQHYQEVLLSDRVNEDKIHAASYIKPLSGVSYVTVAEVVDLVPEVESWSNCYCWYFGLTNYFEAIVYITSPPPGAKSGVYAIGSEVLESTHGMYCLAESFDEWYFRVLQYDGVDPFLSPGTIRKDSPEHIGNMLLERIVQLNPRVEGEIQGLIQGAR